MLPELGHFSLILSLCLYLCLAVVPLVGVYKNNPLLMASSRSLAAGSFVLILLSFLCLVSAFLQDDFSVEYVANHSNTLLPDIYKVSAVWGGHEGSLLLWALTLSMWTFAVSIFSRHLPIDMLARVLSVMGMIAVGFLLFMLLTSNPFDRLLPFPPTNGSDLNPLLQDPGLIIHPPMLYMGYVGFSVAFAFAIAALMSGRLDSAWARWSRPWTTVAWAFLTIGIALGSWWAYYELGWGGWWFWDPVENASFMPWLVGTALIHSLAVTEKRGVFKSWTILLAIFAFSLSLLGTFIVRSGVLTSVHAFASDPERGLFILGFLLIVIGGALLLYALRAPMVKSVVSFNWLSRELFLLLNNILLVIVMITVLLGTLYPLFSDALNWGKISVGPPYFNQFFVPLMGVLCILLGLGPLMLWKKTSVEKVIGFITKPLVISLIAGVLLPVFYEKEYSFFAALTIFVAIWIISTTMIDLLHKIRHAKTISQGLSKLTYSYYGMVSAHIGVAIVVMGACLNTIYSDQRDLRMEEGERVVQGRYEYHLVEIVGVRGPNYYAQRGQIDVYSAGEKISSLFPEKRRYFSSGALMTEVSIDSGFWGDTYVALGEDLGETPEGKQAWAVRLHDKPFVNWIWLGALFMALGGFLAVSDKRYRMKKNVLANNNHELVTKVTG
ncbi:c-type cytochrome biogenesis protein CcmF [Candidatus Endobugula sertula]|uniref:C-type cytochrome biogenesis protein CcmF n=1 Tax=Candidatus Endobugula sertula TaxID=62101 RepID=A0A1D2QT07_9GAMM|nr:c-type cytochrome biogenesis protein CcmF [Candidatus Endobugula sertula]